MEQVLQEADVQKVASSLIRKYDWSPYPGR